MLIDPSQLRQPYGAGRERFSFTFAPLVAEMVRERLEYGRGGEASSFVELALLLAFSALQDNKGALVEKRRAGLEVIARLPTESLSMVADNLLWLAQAMRKRAQNGQE